MAAGIQGQEDIELHASYSEHNDQREDWEGLKVPSYVVRTYKTKKELVLGLPRLVVIGIGLRRYIRKNKIDIVYSSMFSIWQSLAVPLYISNRIFFFPSVHDAIDHPGEAHWLKALCRKIELSYATAAVAYSQHVQTALLERLRGKKEVIYVPHGITSTTTTHRRFPVERELRIGFFGRLVKYKGIDLFVEALQILRSQGVPVRGAVHGDGTIPTDLIQETSEYIDWNVGWVSEHDFDSILAGFDVLALPYIEASQSGVLALGVGRGIPVVATPIGGLINQVLESGGGILSEDVSPSSFAAAITLLANDPALYDRLSHAGLVSSRSKFSWEAVSTQLVDQLSAYPRQAGTRS